MAFGNLMVRTNRNATPARRSLFGSMDFGREFDQLMEGMFSSFGTGPSLGTKETASMMSPKVNISGDERSLELTAEVPGFAEKDLQLTLKDRVLTIKGEMKQEEEQKDHRFYRRERRLGSFQRSFRLPEDVNVDEVNASYENGLLKIHFPKSENRKENVRKIEVKAS